MIGKLTGRLDESGEGFALIDVGGVGYQVFCSSRTLSQLEAIEGAVTLWIETHVREDHIHLYGFIDPAERAWFRLLTTVQGVGSKVGLALLSALSAGDLAAAIAAQDKTSVQRANGVGAKLAQRIVTELKDKVGDLALGAAATRAAAAAATPLDRATEDAVGALVGLGYRRLEAVTAINEARRRLGDTVGVEDLIRAGLKELAR